MNHNQPEQIETMKRDYDELDPSLIALRMIKPKSKVLSVGCGAGREVRYLIKELKCKVVAIDSDAEVIEISKSLEPDAQYIHGDVLDYKGEGFDYIIILWNTINYNKGDKRKKIIEKSSQLLNKDGKLIMTTSHIWQHWRFIFHNLKYRVDYYYPPNEIEYWFEGTDLNFRKLCIGHTTLIYAEKAQ